MACNGPTRVCLQSHCHDSRSIANIVSRQLNQFCSIYLLCHSQPPPFPIRNNLSNLVYSLAGRLIFPRQSIGWSIKKENSNRFKANRTMSTICFHFQSPVLSVLVLYSRLAPELVNGTVKKSKLLGATVLKHRADQQQTKSFIYIWCSSRPKIFVCCCSALWFKTVAPSSLLFLTVPVTSLGPSPQSSTSCQQTFNCCTVWLVWLPLGARKIPYE